jgi:hypothetical protein
MIAPAAATDVQHHRHRCLDQTDLENYRRAGDAINIGQHNRALATPNVAEVVLHVGCTPADSIKIGARL